MNIHTGLPFLQGFLTRVHELDDSGRAFAQGYGNTVASGQAFAPLGHGHAAQHSKALVDPVHAPPPPGRVRVARGTPAVAPGLCVVGACG